MMSLVLFVCFMKEINKKEIKKNERASNIKERLTQNHSDFSPLKSLNQDLCVLTMQIYITLFFT